MISRRSLYSVVGNIGLAVILAACQAKAPGLTGRQRAPGPAYVPPSVKVNQNAPIVPPDPKVDILFVIDDSASMSKHLTNLSNNMEKFVNAFAPKDQTGKTTEIDFHIAYTFATDKSHYGVDIPQVCPQNSDRPGVENWQPAGSLEPIRGLTDRRYVTAQDNFRDLLKNSLDPKANNKVVKSYIAPNPAKPYVCGYGPEREDLITPLLNGLDDASLTLAGGPNQGFRRQGAFFVGIIISDTKDMDNITVDTAIKRIKAAAGTRNGKDNFRIFSVVMKPGDRFNVGACRPDPEWTTKDPKDGHSRYEDIDGQVIPQHSLAALAYATEDGSLPKNSQVLSICSDNYGQTLAQYGAQIQKDVLTNLVFQLGSHPELTSNASKALKVVLKGKSVEGGSRELIQGEEWDFNVSNLTVTVYTKSDEYPNGVDWSKYPGSRVVPSWTPVSQTDQYASPVE